MFADTGIPMLFRSLFERGAEKRRLVVQVAGGARMMQEHDALRHRQTQLSGGAQNSVEGRRADR